MALGPKIHPRKQSQWLWICHGHRAEKSIQALPCQPHEHFHHTGSAITESAKRLKRLEGLI